MRIVIADDQVLTREALRRVIEEAGHQVVGEGDTAEEAVALTRERAPDLILIAVRLPGGGIQAAQRLTDEGPGPTVLMLADHADTSSFFESIRAGARGYLTKDMHTDCLLDLLQTAGRGEPALAPGLASLLLSEYTKVCAENRGGDSPEGLTERELEVLEQMAQGVTSNRALAGALGVSENTVRFHVRHVLEKLHQHSRAAAVAYALTHGIVEAPPECD